ncbi:hypothetical protein HAPAU_14510 [Halalkalicoccus paucihalophilus]|uniref:Uncharacterized protein n=1 Tax=Halalkalicoccus paucihalophilus TaxID=1008153 RepID=A0A151AFH2_9EURY|nr:hypothetical protein [Halalkalicoccus paucihalophilus]KYH26353.1 hypothetical protein HAPAU_14510 [Halalkalicoccus paucihalophilus]
MTDWESVKQELREADYSGFKFESGETPVPGLSGEWIEGEIAREGGLKRENQPLWARILDTLSFSGGAVDADPNHAPESIRKIATQYGLEVVIISISKDMARVALCDPSE